MELIVFASVQNVLISQINVLGVFKVEMLLRRDAP
jgi:hypothetical protein